MRIGWNWRRNTIGRFPLKQEKLGGGVMKGEKENARFTRLAAIVVVTMAIAGSMPLAAQDGATLFKTKCAMCHGADGKGETPIGKKMNIRDLGSAEVQKQTDAELTTIISKGKNKMPAFEGKLTAEQVGQMVAYIRGLGKKK
jgi:mono/diheme cytochrome c family protein